MDISSLLVQEAEVEHIEQYLPLYLYLLIVPDVSTRVCKKY